MKKIKFLLRNHFGFSQRETNGFLYIVALTLLFLFAPLLFRIFYVPASYSDARDQELLDSLLAVMSSGRKKDFSGRRIDTVHAYKAKYNNEYNAKSYKKPGPGSRPYFRSMHTRDSFYVAGRKKPFPAPVKPLDINRADTASLEPLKGIGKTLSARIIRFRDRLGGFISKEQYGEVYGIAPEVLEELNRKTFIAESFNPEKLNVNVAGREALSAHPYIGKKYADRIILYRNQHGKFTGGEDVRAILGIPPEVLEKFLPYLSY